MGALVIIPTYTEVLFLDVLIIRVAIGELFL
jgi:hypothetical protein